LLNEGKETVTTDLAKARFTIPAGSQVAVHTSGTSAITALATDGAASLGTPFADGAGRKLILSLDGKALDRSDAILVLPLGEGELKLGRDLPVAVGEIVDGRWRAYETLASSRDVPITELRSTAFLLLCPTDQRDRWTKAIETLVTQP
ncbi:MAG: hypothetical protein HN380_32100, partial [Victivallales bacterium]|nr:hypothetical protein [Victivallales bacterium]